MLQVNFNGMWKAYKKCNERYSTPPGTCLQKQQFFDVNKITRVANFLKNATICNGDFASVNIKEGDWTMLTHHIVTVLFYIKVGLMRMTK